MKVIYCWYFNDIWPSLQPINKYSLKFQFSLIFSISVWLCWVYVYSYSYNLLSSSHWPLVEKSRKLFGWKKNCLEIDLTWNTIFSTKCYSMQYTLKAAVLLDFEWFFFSLSAPTWAHDFFSSYRNAASHEKSLRSTKYYLFGTGL